MLGAHPITGQGGTRSLSADLEPFSQHAVSSPSSPEATLSVSSQDLTGQDSQIDLTVPSSLGPFNLTRVVMSNHLHNSCWREPCRLWGFSQPLSLLFPCRILWFSPRLAPACLVTRAWELIARTYVFLSPLIGASTTQDEQCATRRAVTSIPGQALPCPLTSRLGLCCRPGCYSIHRQAR